MAKPFQSVIYRLLASGAKLLFRPAGRVTFVSRDKSNQKRLPRHPALRFAPGSFAPSPFQGHAAKGHPWPIAALAASMPLNPFHGDSTHPPEGAVGVACRFVQKKQIKPKSSRTTRSPFPSVGRVEVLRSSVGWKTAKPFPRVTSRLLATRLVGGAEESLAGGAKARKKPSPFSDIYRIYVRNRTISCHRCVRYLNIKFLIFNLQGKLSKMLSVGLKVS